MKQIYLLLFLCTALTPTWMNGQVLVWGKQLNNSDNGHLYVRDNVTDRYGNVYIAGQFNGTIDFDPGPGVSVYSTLSINRDAAFVAKYDSSGKLLWARTIVSDTLLSNASGIASIALDNTGCVYTLGYFHSSADFDPGPGLQRKHAAYGRDIFVEKWDASGNFNWVVSFPGSFSATPKDLAVDGEYNVYITGTFGSTVDFDPTTAVNNMTATPAELDGFLVKITTTGGFVWSRQISGSASVYPAAITLGENEHIYLTGHYYGTADFDPGPGTHNLISNGYDDIFVAKYGPGGGMVWAHSFGGPHDDRGVALTNDNDGSTYVTGKFSKSIDIDPGAGVHTLTAAGSDDVFILKLDRNGAYQWAHGIGGAGMDEGRSVSVSGSSVNLAISYRDVIDIDPGQAYVPAGSAGKFQAGYISLDKAGNYKWAVTENNAVYMPGSCYMGEDDAGYIYATNHFHGTIDCDPGPAVYNLSAANNQQAFFIVKLRPATMPSAVTEAAKTKGVRIYPNPTNGILYLSAEEDIDRVVITDIAGRVVYDMPIQGKNISLNLPAAGVYTIAMMDEQWTVVEKVVVAPH